jgi:hypothetical protein
LPCREQGPFSWSNGSGEYFNVRRGPNYSWNGQKSPSLESFYECIATDLVYGETRIDHIASKVQLPEIPARYRGLALPALFVVNVQLPHAAPSLTGTKGDGKGASSAFYFRLRDSTVDALQPGAEPPSNAMKLLMNYVLEAPKSKKVQGGFKVISILDNMKEIGLASMDKYNGKPVLIKNSGTLYKGKDYMEMDINVHLFSMITRKTLHGLQSSFAKMELKIGFVIQGAKDEELPEQMIGAVSIHSSDFTKCTPLGTIPPYAESESEEEEEEDVLPSDDQQSIDSTVLSDGSAVVRSPLTTVISDRDGEIREATGADSVPGSGSASSQRSQEFGNTNPTSSSSSSSPPSSFSTNTSTKSRNSWQRSLDISADDLERMVSGYSISPEESRKVPERARRASELERKDEQQRELARRKQRESLRAPVARGKGSSSAGRKGERAGSASNRGSRGSSSGLAPAAAPLRRRHSDILNWTDDEVRI